MKAFTENRVQTGILAGAVVVVVLVAAVNGFYLPTWGWIVESRAVTRDLNIKIADAEFVSTRLPQQREALAKAKAEFQAAQANLGGGKATGRALAFLHERASAARLQITASQEAASTNASGVAGQWEWVPIKLRLQGDYAALGEFIGSLEQAPFACSVKRLTIAAEAGEPPRLAAEALVEILLSTGEKSL